MSRAFQCLNAGAMSLLALVLSAELITQTWPGARFVEFAQGQNVGAEKERMVMISPVHREPVKVINITENGKYIVPGRDRKPEVPGQAFHAGEDWISNLSFVLKNVTPLNIEMVRISIVFREDQQYDWLLDLGQLPALAAATYTNRPRVHPPIGTGRPLNLGPGQEMVIPLSGIADKIKAAKYATKPFSDLTRCAIVVDAVFFEKEGMLWTNGGYGYALPDPDGPYGYRRLAPAYFPGDPSPAKAN